MCVYVYLLLCEIWKLGNTRVFSNMKVIARITIIISATKVILNMNIALFALE